MLLAFPSWTWIILNSPWNRGMFWHGLTKTPRGDVGVKVHLTLFQRRTCPILSAFHLPPSYPKVCSYGLCPPSSFVTIEFFFCFTSDPHPTVSGWDSLLSPALVHGSLNSGDKVTLYSFWLALPRTFCSSESRWPCQLSWPRAAQWVSIQWWYPGILEERARCWIWVDYWPSPTHRTKVEPCGGPSSESTCP